MGNGKLRRIVAVLGLLVFTSLYSPPTQTRAIEVVHLGTISPGERVDADPVFVPGPTGSWHYTFSVAGKGAALRVGIDLSQRDTCIFFSLFDPNGVEVEADWVDWPVVCPNDGTSQSFNADLTAFNPKPGFYTVQVHALDVDELAFRLRVVFETKAKTPRQLLPNLVPWTPWEFGFAAPDSANPGTANDTSNLPGDPTVSCHPEEEAGAIDCLRFSAGVYNIGDGPMFIAFRGDDAFQHVYTRDGTAGFYPDNEGRGRYTETPAGTGEFHEFHDHRHLANFVLYELLSVDNAETGALTSIGSGDKHGYCTFSQQIRDWDLANQDHQYASFTNVGAFCRDYMTLERGWGDIYRWQRPGQFVSYEPIAEADGTMPAGLYVLRFTVDPLDNVVETDETDNVGYTLIRVVDGGGPGLDSVIECEQGLGRSPWDPAKAVIDDRLEWAKRAANPTYVPPSCD